ncbi:C10 family peptidase [Thermodesulfobacteriota bacterium]
MSKILLLWICLIFVLGVGNVTGAESEYDLVAQNFLKYLKSDKEILSSELIDGNALDEDMPKVPIVYLVNLKEGGFILIQPSQDLTPIKAYSLKGDFETLPPAVRQFLLNETEYNIRAINSPGRTPQSAAAAENQQRWDFLLNYQQMRAPLSYNAPDILLSTKWNQDDPYNKFLPEIAGQKVLTGCVNVAMGQVMKYHAYPQAGKGVAYHYWNEQHLKAILYRPYNWQNMPDVLDTTQPEYKVDEVARLISDLGIANNTSFGLDNSGAVANISALIENFGLTNDIMRMENTDHTTFLTTLKAEIDALRPVLLSFPGHMGVADGYGSDPLGDKIHVNFGWGGHDDDFYFLDQDVAAGNSIFPPNLVIYYNIKPCSGEECFRNLEAEDSIDGLAIAGKFDFDRDSDKYEVYLKGQTNILGSRPGVGNQAFYISVYNSSNIRVTSSDEALDLNLAADKYTIRVSLHDEIGGYYIYDENQVNYDVTITTEALSDAEITSIDANLDVSPVIFNDFKDIVLNSSSAETHHILIDARDENGNPVNINVGNTNPNAVQFSLTENILALSPSEGAVNVASRITVSASANGQSAEKSFIVIISGEEVAFGKEFEVSGIFESQEDFNTHKVILDGACVISGYRGFSNQAFYTSVIDFDQNVVLSPNNEPINHSFSQGLYFIGASLEENPGGPGGYYPYEQGVNDQYIMSVSCPDADDSVGTIAGLLGIDLSGTEGPAVYKGDINADGYVSLADAVLCLQTLSGMNPSGIRSNYPTSGADVNSDGTVGLVESIYILQKVADLR